MLIRVLVPIFLSAISLIGFAWVGLKIRAPRLPTLKPGDPPSTQSLPDDLPVPVARYASALFGDAVPNVQSAIVQGRARLAPTGMNMQTRFRFYYDAADPGYYHDIRVTWWRRTVLRIHEILRDDYSILDLSILGRVENDPQTNRAAKQGFWAEVLAWVPSIALSDPRVKWEAVNDTSARLILPDLDDEEAFTVRFDTETGLLTEIETMRYADGEDATRSRWRNRVLAWGTIDGHKVPVISETQWNNDTPWATWEVEQVLLNADVSARMAQFGGDV